MRRRMASIICSSILPPALRRPAVSSRMSTTWFQRLDAEAAYKFDKVQVAQLGWKGDIIAKLHYAWESNAVVNWQNDPLAPYNVPALASGNSAIFMAYDNPNYNVHMLMASLAFKW